MIFSWRIPINSLKPSVTIWRHRTCSSLVQVVICFLTAPRHYRNLCWLIVCEVCYFSQRATCQKLFKISFVYVTKLLLQHYIHISLITSSNGNISALLDFCVSNSPVTGEFPKQRPVTRSFEVFFDLRLKKLLSKQTWDRWFETPSHPSWCLCKDWV